MKIAIFTQPLSTNIGGILQNYALQTVLKRMGHSVITLDPLPIVFPIWYLYPLVLIKRIIHKYFVGNHDIIPLYEFYAYQQYRIVGKNIIPFIKKHIRLKKIKYPIKKDISQTYDVLLVGSDQVWRYRYNRERQDDMFLSFAKSKRAKRIAYSASFGTDKLEFSKEQIQRYTKLLQHFDAVSVRETSAVKVCKEVFGVHATWTLDPTLLLSAKDYTSLFSSGGTITEKRQQLLVYFLDQSEDKTVLANLIASEKKISIVHGNNPQNEKFHLSPEKRVQTSIESWLRLFAESSYVVTDSFHGSVFSIIFRKPFIIYMNPERGNARIDSLIEKFHLKNNVVISSNDYKSGLSNDINYYEIENLLDRYQKDSYAYLTNALQQ